MQGLGETTAGRNACRALLLLLLLSVSNSNTSDGTEIVIVRNQKLAEIQKIWKHFVLNRATESKDFRKRKDTIKK